MDYNELIPVDLSDYFIGILFPDYIGIGETNNNDSKHGAKQNSHGYFTGAQQTTRNNFRIWRRVGSDKVM
ncbi:MAG: hypothetical protein JXR87_00715 [Candidatus Marinimicrobia bacterium]|nr:hypothetical protein [Candidatus Neomarinimicrobiota bacterium]